MSYLAQRLTIKHVLSQNLEKSIMVGFGIILGQEYAKKHLIFLFALQKVLFKGSKWPNFRQL